MNRAGFDQFKRKVKIGDYVQFEYGLFERRHAEGHILDIGRFSVSVSENPVYRRYGFLERRMREKEGLLYFWIKSYQIVSPPK